ncbi:hypothetical protein [Sciscionella marina]|uniref:hypothetical protein n=1 Tax=Sciscionella marina TaxID=508770 RepID=UPI0003716946|nr:hypothetical protein [Sciscionella marina]
MSELSPSERRHLGEIEEQLTEQLTRRQLLRFTRARGFRRVPCHPIAFAVALVIGVSGPPTTVLLGTLVGANIGMAAAIALAALLTVVMLAGADWA